MRNSMIFDPFYNYPPSLDIILLLCWAKRWASCSGGIVFLTNSPTPLSSNTIVNLPFQETKLEAPSKQWSNLNPWNTILLTQRTLQHLPTNSLVVLQKRLYLGHNKATSNNPPILYISCHQIC